MSCRHGYDGLTEEELRHRLDEAIEDRNKAVEKLRAWQEDAEDYECPACMERVEHDQKVAASAAAYDAYSRAEFSVGPEYDAMVEAREKLPAAAERVPQAGRGGQA